MFPIRDNIESRSLPIITWIIIAINSLVFLMELSVGSGVESFLQNYGLVPEYFLSHLGLPGASIGRLLLRADTYNDRALR